MVCMPSRYSLERSIDVDADLAAIHHWIDDFRRWREWSAWEDLDPAMSRDYSGPASGVGACYRWAGNRRAGRGEMSIAVCDPHRVAIQVRLERPVAALNEVEFLLTPMDAGTQVTWVTSGRLTASMRLMKAAGLIDKGMGRDVERGLRRLKGLAEGAGG